METMLVILLFAFLLLFGWVTTLSKEVSELKSTKQQKASTDYITKKEFDNSINVLKSEMAASKYTNDPTAIFDAKLRKMSELYGNFERNALSKIDKSIEQTNKVLAIDQKEQVRQVLREHYTDLIETHFKSMFIGINNK